MRKLLTLANPDIRLSAFHNLVSREDTSVRRAWRFLIVAAFLAALPSPAHAALVTIDFDGFADLEDLTTQIPGLTFSNAQVLTSGAVGGSLNEIDFPPRSDFNVLFDAYGPITIGFAAPVANFSVYLTRATVVTLSFFDAGANPLGGPFSLNPNLGSNEQFASGLAAISSVIIAGDLLGGSFALDDLAFETSDTPMPEPGTLALIGSGLAALAYRRKSRRRTL